MSLLPTHWYYNTESGQLTQGNNLENLGNNLVGGAGWHELNVPGNATEAQAAAEAKKEFPHGKPVTTQGIANPAKDAERAASSTLGNVTGAITGFSGTNFTRRALKVVIGAALLIIGVSHLTGSENALTRAARKVPVVPL